MSQRISGKKLFLKEVKVDGVTWQRVASFEAYKSHDHVYSLKHNEDGSTTVQFGDGIQGARPPSGSRIVAFIGYGYDEPGDENIEISMKKTAAPVSADLALWARINASTDSIQFGTYGSAEAENGDIQASSNRVSRINRWCIFVAVILAALLVGMAAITWLWKS